VLFEQAISGVCPPHERWARKALSCPHQPRPPSKKSPPNSPKANRSLSNSTIQAPLSSSAPTGASSPFLRPNGKRLLRPAAGLLRVLQRHHNPNHRHHQSSPAKRALLNPRNKSRLEGPHVNHSHRHPHPGRRPA